MLDVGLDEASDASIWEYASVRKFVLVTKDDDFLRLAAREQAPVQVVWVRLGNCRNKALIQAFESVLEKLTERLKLGDRIIEIR